MSDTAAIISAFVVTMMIVGLWIAAIAAWITHVIVCIKASAWILLLFGCIIAPVGVAHGIGVWLGVF